MADTRVLKSRVEDYVRDWLQQKFGRQFRSDRVPLTGVQGEPKAHEFDAVSEDNAIICGVKTSSWKTSGGKRGAGKIAEAYTEIYFLSHVAGQEKYLVLTDPEFYERMKSEVEGKLAVGIGLLHCALPFELEKEVADIRTKSRKEQGSQVS